MNRLKSLRIICVLCFILLDVRAQDEAAIRPVIEAGDLKKLEKADEYREDADKLIEEANKLNMDVFSVQSDPELTEKAKTSKTGQLENQARQKHIQASDLYEKCNEIKFALYKEYLDRFWKDHAGEESNYINAKLLEEQASDNYFQAASYRIDAKRMKDDTAKVEKLTDANNLEIQAIQKQLTALGTYYGIGEPAVNVSPDETGKIPEAIGKPEESDSVTRIMTVVPALTEEQETTMPGQLVLNQEMIDLYNRYMASGQFTDTTLSTGNIAGITTFDANRMLQLWYDYIYGRGALVTEAPVTADADTIGTVADRVLPEEDVNKPAEIGIITDENKNQMIPAGEEVIYRIQIAANRNELSQRALNRMYYGNKSIEMINENGWYKYSIGDFDTYEEASRFRKSSGISDAFIIAYRKGTKFLPGSAVTEIKTPTVYTPEGEQRLPPGLIFRIQIAACRVPLTVGQLERIYTGNYPVEMITEEGWYKYQFMGVRLYSDALEILRNAGVTGAFIVAYENGTKTNLAEAVAKNRELEEMVKSRGRKGVVNDIEYHLQLAASRVAMKPDELRVLYSGSEAISVILEDGWYKYHLKAGNSPEMAEQFKKACGISNAFIVPYRRAAKILYYETFQEIK